MNNLTKLFLFALITSHISFSAAQKKEHQIQMIQVEQESNAQNAAMHSALDKDKKEEVIISLTNGADPNAIKENSGSPYTPLVKAAYNNRDEYIALFMAAGADPHIGISTFNRNLGTPYDCIHLMRDYDRKLFLITLLDDRTASKKYVKKMFTEGGWKSLDETVKKNFTQKFLEEPKKSEEKSDKSDTPNS